MSAKLRLDSLQSFERADYQRALESIAKHLGLGSSEIVRVKLVSFQKEQVSCSRCHRYMNHQMIITKDNGDQLQICADFKDCDNCVNKVDAKEARDLIKYMKDQAEQSP